MDRKMITDKIEVSAVKLTDVDLLRSAASTTIGHESQITLERAYALGHSIIRTQLFWVECKNIPLFVASQLVRSHVGVQFFQRSKRTDRGGADFEDICSNISDYLAAAAECEDGELQHEALSKAANDIRSMPEEYDRYAPTDISFIANAEALINMAHKRLCLKASDITTYVVGLINRKVGAIDRDLAKHLVPQCVYRGGICPEHPSCGLAASEAGQIIINKYRQNYDYEKKN